MKVLSSTLEQLPVNVRFWDGSEYVAHEDPDVPVVLIEDERAIAHFLHSPNQLGLSRAWVSGCLDVDGDLEKVLDLRHSVRDLSLGRMDRLRLAVAALRVTGARALRRPPIPRSEAAPRAGCTRCAATGPRCAITTTSPTASTRCCSARAWSTRARTSPPRRLARGGAGAQARGDLPQAAPAAGRALARHRLRLGLARAARRASTTACARSASRSRSRRPSSRAGAIARGGPGRPRRGPRARLPRARRRRRSTRSRASACTSTSAARSSTPTCDAVHRCCGRAGCSSTTASRASTPSRRAARRSSAATSSPTASCIR